jgi:hypothetical protein
MGVEIGLEQDYLGGRTDTKNKMSTFATFWTFASCSIGDAIEPFKLISAFTFVLVNHSSYSPIGIEL